MEDQKTRKNYEEYYLCRNLYQLIVNDFSMYLSYVHGTNGKNRIEDYKAEINEILKLTNMDNHQFNKLLGEYIENKLGQKKEEKELTIEDLATVPKKRIFTPIETFIIEYQKTIEEKLRLFPNSLDKAIEFLLGLISAYNTGYYSDQIYDAMLLLKDQIPSKIINEIRQNWRNEAIDHAKRYREEILVQKTFWSSSLEYEQIDAISRYRFKTKFSFTEFEFAFEEVEEQLEELILETRRSSLGTYDLWLISRSQILADKLAGIDIKLKGYISNQHEDGYWKNENRPDITTPSMFMTALITSNLLKLSPSKASRQSGVKGAKWILTKQDPDGSWSIETRKGGKEPDIFITIICLEILKRCGLENSKSAVKKGEDWIINQQNATGIWIDEFSPFPFLTVLVLEYFKNKDLFSHQLPLYTDDWTPENIIFSGMKRAIEISRNCKSEPDRISPKVGAVVIKGEEIVLEAYRGETSSGDHAEYVALEKKERDFDLEEAILITTLEPCTFRKQIKIPCAKRVVDAGIKKIWIGMLDPNPKIRGGGVLYLTDHGVSVGYFPPQLIKEIKDINNEFWEDQIKKYFEDTSESQIDIMATNEETGN